MTVRAFPSKNLQPYISFWKLLQHAARSSSLFLGVSSEVHLPVTLVQGHFLVWLCQRLMGHVTAQFLGRRLSTFTSHEVPVNPLVVLLKCTFWLASGEWGNILNFWNSSMPWETMRIIGQGGDSLSPGCARRDFPAPSWASLGIVLHMDPHFQCPKYWNNAFQEKDLECHFLFSVTAIFRGSVGFECLPSMKVWRVFPRWCSDPIGRAVPWSILGVSMGVLTSVRTQVPPRRWCTPGSWTTDHALRCEATCAPAYRRHYSHWPVFTQVRLWSEVPPWGHCGCRERAGKKGSLGRAGPSPSSVHPRDSCAKSVVETHKIACQQLSATCWAEGGSSFSIRSRSGWG